MESLIGASCITKFHYQVHATRVLHMSHTLSQRIFIILCQSFLITLDFACQPYPQCVSESHEVVVLLSLLVGNLEPSSRHLLIGHWLGGFPCVRWQEIYSHIGIRTMSWMWLSLLVVSFPLSKVFLIGFYSEGILHALLASSACETCTGLLVHEHVLHLNSYKSSRYCFVPHVEWLYIP